MYPSNHSDKKLIASFPPSAAIDPQQEQLLQPITDLQHRRNILTNQLEGKIQWQAHLNTEGRILHFVEGWRRSNLMTNTKQIANFEDLCKVIKVVWDKGMGVVFKEDIGNEMVQFGKNLSTSVQKKIEAFTEFLAIIDFLYEVQEVLTSEKYEEDWKILLEKKERQRKREVEIKQMKEF